MRKCFIACMLLLTALVAWAQQSNYKYILQHLPEYSDREALYHLQDYHAWYPKKPHPYFLMANIEYRLQAGEHAIIDFFEKDRMLYNAQVYYGNCNAYLPEEHIKADMYPEVAKDGKLAEAELRMWLIAHRDTAKQMRESLNTLYDSYCQLALCYDSCRRDFTSLCSKYNQQKDALLMADSTDEALLNQLLQRALQLPTHIASFQKALAVSPIPNYQPTFRFVHIEYYRLEGVTTTNLLQDDIALWDYATWVKNFLHEQKEVNRIKKEMAGEHKRLVNGIVGAKGENRFLLNRIRRYDTESPLADFLHAEYLGVQIASALRLIRRDSVAEDDKLPIMQQAYKVLQMRTEQQLIAANLPSRLHDEATILRYRDLLATMAPEETVQKEVEHTEQLWSDFLTWLAPTIGPEPIQITETLVAEIKDGKLSIRQ